MDGVGPGESDQYEPAGADPPLTVEALADLQAGLLDNDAAARLRKQVRADPDARQTMDALNRVRSDIAALGTDAVSAPDVAPEVVDGIAASLRSQRPAHTSHPGRLPRSTRVAVGLGGLVGLIAAAVAAWLGTAALISPPTPTPSRPTTAEHITVSRPPMSIPLSNHQILALLDDKPDFGPLADPQRRTSCLAGLGYPPDTQVLGARPVQIAGRPAVLLVFAGDKPGILTALAVAPTCSSADTGLLADRRVDRP